MPPVRRSLRWRVIALGVLVPLVAVAVFLIWQDYQARRTYLLSLLEVRSEQINVQLEDFVGGTSSVARLFALAFEQRFPNATVDLARPAGEQVQPDSHLIALLDACPGRYESASVVAPDGTLLASFRPFIAGARTTEPAFIEDLRGSDALVVSDVFPATDRPTPTVMFGYPIDNAAGHPVAYLVLRSALSTLSAVLDMSHGFPASARSGIFDGTGRVLAAGATADADAQSAVGRDISQSAVWAQAQRRPTTPWYGPGLDGVQRVIFFEYPAATPWITTVAYDQSEVFSPLWSRVLALSLALAVSVIGTLALAELADHQQRTALTVLMHERQIDSRQAVAREAQHHVRNALQVLRLRQAEESDPEIQAHVDNAIERIEWVLREILPGTFEGPRTPPRDLGRPEPSDTDSDDEADGAADDRDTTDA